MAWDNSTRSERLPPDWQRRRRRVLRRDTHQCTHHDPDGNRCPHQDPTGRTLECDHITPGDDHSLHNLQTLCHDHHQQKTIAERRPPRHRPTEPHPGAR